MNLPNKLTLLRCVLVPPVVLVLLLAPEHGWIFWLAALVLFSIAALTDAFDGAIARSRGLVTNFGKLMDPVADKLLVTAVFTCFVATGLCTAWILIIVLAREFLVMSIRMVASCEGVVIAANKWGKLKTITQMTAIVTVMVAQLTAALLPATLSFYGMLCEILYYLGLYCLWIAALMTIISGIVYCWQSKALFKDAK